MAEKTKKPESAALKILKLFVAGVVAWIAIKAAMTSISDVEERNSKEARMYSAE
ncbi:MAG: hypothetical protein AAGJ79_01080 [Verrucomicrobiota bacterium]